MLFQGERLPSLDVERIIGNIFGQDMHAKRTYSLSNAVLGVISSGSLIVHRIGLGLAKSQKLLGKHAVKQVDRLLSNPKLAPEQCFIKLVPYLVANRKEVVVAMDWTDFDKDNQATLQISLITSHGRATPLLWRTIDKSTLKNNRNNYEYEILQLLKSCLPENSKVTVLADRGFSDTKLYDFLKKLGFSYIIRMRGNVLVKASDDEAKKALDWVSKNGRARTLRNAKVTAKEYTVPTVVCMKAAGMKEPWCIVASDPEISGSKVVHWYSKRWGIEPQFRDTKNLHFGMGLSDTSISSPARRDRLLLISTLAVIILTMLGAVGERLGLDRYLKVNTVKHRTMSLFRQGCHYYCQIAKMTAEELSNFLGCFMAMLKEHSEITDILWVL